MSSEPVFSSINWPASSYWKRIIRLASSTTTTRFPAASFLNDQFATVLPSSPAYLMPRGRPSASYCQVPTTPFGYRIEVNWFLGSYVKRNDRLSLVRITASRSDASYSYATVLPCGSVNEDRKPSALYV